VRSARLKPRKKETLRKTLADIFLSTRRWMDTFDQTPNDGSSVLAYDNIEGGTNEG